MDANSLLASLLIGSIGMVLFLYGKKQERAPHIVVGLVLLVYTYFISNIILMFVICAILLGALWCAVKMGW